MNKKKVILIGVASVVAVAAIAAWYVLYQRAQTSQKSTSSLTVTKVCSDDMIRKASTALSAGDSVALAALRDTILAIDGYRGDINCDYILVHAELASGNSNGAKRALADLRELSLQSSYSSVFSPAPKSIAELEIEIEASPTLSNMRMTGGDEIESPAGDGGTN